MSNIWQKYNRFLAYGLSVVLSVVGAFTYLTLQAPIAFAALGFDNKSSAFSAVGASSLTWSHTVNSNTNGILVVDVQYNDGSAPAVHVQSVTYNGTSLTFVRNDHGTGNAQIQTEVWYLVAPSTGANNVVVTMTGAVGGGSGRYIIGGAVSLTGADQTSPIDAQAGGGSSSVGTAISQAVTTVANNAWVLAFVSGGKFDSYTSSQTLAYSTNDGSGTSNGSGAGAYTGPVTPAGSQTMSFTASTNENWAISVVSIAPAAATVATTDAIFFAGD